MPKTLLFPARTFLAILAALFLANCTATDAPGVHKLSQHEDDVLHHEGELLIHNPPDGYEKTLPELGMSLIDITEMDGLDIKLYHIKIEDGAHPFEARLAHRKRHPNVTVDVHHHFEQHAIKKKRKTNKSYTSRRAAAWAFASEKCGVGIRLGMLDGGVDIKHPAFKGHKITYRSFYLKGQAIGAIGHGTAVANVMTGNKKWGGLLPSADLFAANVFHLRTKGRHKGKARASAKSILLALNWISKQKVDVINISIGGSYNSLIAHAIEQASKRGIILIASAGNSGPFTKKKSFPAAYDQAIAIAATNQFGNTAKFSSAGNYVEFAAPGVKIWTAVPGGGKAMSGTSFSAPIISSYVALASKQHGLKDLKSVRRFLLTRTKHGEKSAWNKYNGWGIVQTKPAC
jgi:hypothetical protein